MTLFATILWTCLGVAIVAGAGALLLNRPAKEPPRPAITELPRPAAAAEHGAHDAFAPHQLSVIVQRRHWIAARQLARRDGITVDDYVAALIDADTVRQEQVDEKLDPTDSLSARAPLASRTEGRARPGEHINGATPSGSQGVPCPDPLGTVPGPRRDATHSDTGVNAAMTSITADRRPYRCGDETAHPGPSVSPSRDGDGPGFASKFP